MKPLIICKNHDVFRAVCTMYGFNVNAVRLATGINDLDGISETHPVFVYSSYLPNWFLDNTGYLEARQHNIIYLREVQYN